MGLFRKNPAEKKLKELTGGFKLSHEFLERLKGEGLSIGDGAAIQNQLKKDIKSGKVKEEGLELRLEYLIDLRKKGLDLDPSSKNVKRDDDKEVIVISKENMDQDNKVREIKFLANQEHNLVKCPKCRANVLKSNRFCYNCGANIILSSGPVEQPFNDLSERPVENSFNDLSERSVENSFNENVASSSNQEDKKASEDKSTLDELSELEKLYNQKVSSKYSPKFKFAYVLYLNHLNKNPSKKFPEDRYISVYDTSLNKLEKQALDDEFLEDGNPLIAAQSATVSDIKNVLKEHDLKVSGKKDDLIERLGQNLSEEALKEAFPQKVLAVSDKGLEFIEKNRYVFYYDNTSQLRSNLDVDEYDSIFVGIDDLSDENISNLLIEYLLKRENDLVSKNYWSAYRYNLIILGRAYKDSDKDLELLDIDFKLFIAGINNFSDYSNKSEPACAYIGKTYSDELISLLHSLGLSIDELKDKFNASYDDLKYPDLKISKGESLVYLLKLFSGTDIQELTEEIRSKYPDENTLYF